MTAICFPAVPVNTLLLPSISEELLATQHTSFSSCYIKQGLITGRPRKKLNPKAYMQSMSTDSPSQSPTAENGENNLQPFFVLHKAVPKKGDKKVSGSGKTRSRLDLSVASLKPTDKSEEANQFQEDDYDRLRVEAFHVVWSEIEAAIKEVLRNININVFDVINQWVHESFSSIRSTGIHWSSHSYTPVTSITCKQIFTGLMFTRNVDFVDDLLTFKELAMHLRSHGCHVVTLSSLDFSAKNGIGVCIRSLLRQLIMVTPDTADIAILASWYSEPQHCDSPLVLMIDDMERCNGSVLSELILMLSEWVVKIPIILIMGVATTVDAPRKLLPSTALQYLSACEFTLGSPAERMDAIVEAVLLKLSSGFNIGYHVAVFLRNYFLKQDGTITAFIRALRIACAKHFSMEPLSFLCKDFLNEDSQSLWTEESVLLPEPYLKYAFDLPSLKSQSTFSDVNAEDLASGLSSMRRLRKEWSSVVLCLYEVGKFHRLQFFDIFCEALDPALYDLRVSSKHQSGEVLQTTLAKDSLNDGGYSGKKEGFIFQAICKLRDLPVARLSQVLQVCKKHTEEIPEIHGRFEKLQSMLKVEGDTEILKQNKTSTSKRPTARGHLNMEKNTGRLNEKVVTLMQSIVRDYLKPIECVPFHEIFCFKNVEILQSSLIGDPRRMIQIDLQKPHVHLHCNCCSKSGNALLPSLNDSSIIYKLAQEHGDLINLHDWFQSYKSIVLRLVPKGKGKSQKSVSKKRKSTEQTQVLSVASVQAQFCKAVTDLQITGLLRMPSKRRPDFVQRIAFGL